MDVPKDLVRAATSFGGGIGLTKNICGCITAAALAVGLKYGSLEPTGIAPGPAYARSKAITDKFEQRFGSTQCKELTAPFTDFGSRERAYQCGEFIEFVIEELKEVLFTPEEDPQWREPWWEDYLSRRDKIR